MGKGLHFFSRLFGNRGDLLAGTGLSRTRFTGSTLEMGKDSEKGMKNAKKYDIARIAVAGILIIALVLVIGTFILGKNSGQRYGEGGKKRQPSLSERAGGTAGTGRRLDP